MHVEIADIISIIELIWEFHERIDARTSDQCARPTSTDLKEIAVDVVRRAMQGGATAAEAVAMDGSEFSTVVRLGEVETLKESGSKGIGVRVFFGQRAASTYSSDLTPEGCSTLVDSALRAGQGHERRSVRGHSRAGAAGQAGRRPRALQRRRVFAVDGGPHRLCAAGREGGAWTPIRASSTRKAARFDAAISYKVLANSNGFVGDFAALVLFGVGGADRAGGRLEHAARLLVFGGE